MAVAVSRGGLWHVCSAAEYGTSASCFGVHIAPAAPRGAVILDRKECDEIFKVLQKCVAEMWSPLEGRTT